MLLLFKLTFVIGENDLLFGMCSSVFSTLISLVPADSTEKLFLLFLLLGNNISGNTKVYCLEYFMTILKIDF